MLRKVLGLLLAGCFVACGSAPPPAATAPTKAEAAEPQRCLASTARKRPVGWVETGKLVVALRDGQPTSFEAHDASGRVVASKSAPADGEAARAMMSDLTCKVGGLVAAFDGPPPPKQGIATVTLPVMKPRAVDEKADLVRMCRPPEGVPTGPDGPDESQKVRIAFDIYEEALTTTKWRGWLADLLDANRKATDDAARLSVRKAKGEELKAAAVQSGVTGPCWFAEGIAKPPEPPR